MYSNEPTYSGMDKEAGFNDFSHPEKDYGEIARMGFIRKVYGILSAQLVLTFGFILLGTIPAVKSALSSNAGTAMIFFCIALVLSFVTLIPLACVRSIGRSVPINYILLFAFTLCESYMLMLCCANYNDRVVIAAAALTAGVTVALTIYAFTTKTDFTWLGGMLFAGICILIVTGLLYCIIKPTEVFYLLYCAAGVFIYSIYLIYDTQLISGKFGNAFEIDDYVIAAVNVYLDIINIFLYILSILGRK